MRMRTSKSVHKAKKNCAAEVIAQPNRVRAIEMMAKREGVGRSTVNGWIRAYFPEAAVGKGGSNGAAKTGPGSDPQVVELVKRLEKAIHSLETSTAYLDRFISEREKTISS